MGLRHSPLDEKADFRINTFILDKRKRMPRMTAMEIKGFPMLIRGFPEVNAGTKNGPENSGPFLNSGWLFIVAVFAAPA
jgi:hypothetical protein